MRTEKQRQQWKSFNNLGQLVGLSRWILTKECEILRMDKLSEWRRARISRYIELLSVELLDAAKELGWKGPKNETDDIQT